MSVPEYGTPLPVHGFVLAGGKSSRMGRDKALLPFQGRPMVEIAVEKLHTFCANVSISGSREDLARFAPVVRDVYPECGPIAGLQAGLAMSGQPWSLFLPVDVPRVPAALLRTWAEAVLARMPEGCRLSFLQASGQRQPAFCLLHKDCLRTLDDVVEQKVHKLGMVFGWVGRNLGQNAVWVADVEDVTAVMKVGGAPIDAWFSNVNTPEELAQAERECEGSAS